MVEHISDWPVLLFILVASEIGVTCYETEDAVDKEAVGFNRFNPKPSLIYNVGDRRGFERVKNTEKEASCTYNMTI